MIDLVDSPRTSAALLARIVSLQQENGISLEEAEASVIETTHAQIGAWLAEKWNLPKIICETILHHHDSWESMVENEFVACVQLGDYLCHKSKIGQSGRLALPALDGKLWEVFRSAGIALDETFLPALQTEFLLEFDKSETFLSMVGDRPEGWMEEPV
jgi:hypothetical protein